MSAHLFLQYLQQSGGEGEEGAATASPSPAHSPSPPPPTAAAVPAAASAAALRLLCQLLCTTGLEGKPASEAEDRGWELLRGVWAEVEQRLQQLQELAPAATAEEGARSSASAPADSNRKGRGGKKDGTNVPPKRRGAGKGASAAGGTLPPEQAEQLRRTREAIQTEQRLARYLQAMQVVADWIRQQSNGASDLSEPNAQLLVSCVRGLLQLLGASFATSHQMAVSVVVALCRLSPSLQQQLESACLSALTLTSSSAASVDLSLAHAHPRPLCLLLVELLKVDNGEKLSQALWQTALTVLQHSESSLLRQQVLRLLLPQLLKADQQTQERKQRMQQLYSLLQSMWSTARQQVLPESERSPSSFPSSPLLSPSYRTRLVTHRPQLVHLPDILCSYYTELFHCMDEKQQQEMQEWVLDIILSGLSSTDALLKKQSLYLLHLRLLLLSPTASSDEYSPEQWVYVQQLYQTLEGTFLHLTQSVLPRLQQLCHPTPRMAPWLELIVQKACLHTQPSIAAASFQQLHSILATEQTEQKIEDVASSSPPLPPVLPPSCVLGPILLLFDDSTLFSSDKNTSARVGDNLAPFLLFYMKSLPEQVAADDASACSRTSFIRALLSRICDTRPNVSFLSLVQQLSALSTLPPSGCLREEELGWLLSFTQHRVSRSATRVRPMLFVHTLQVIFRHADWSSVEVDAKLVARLLAEFPEEWFRANSASRLFVQQTLSQETNGEAWLARHVPGAIQEYFDSLQASSAASTPALPLAELRSEHERLMRLLLVVPEGSALEAELLQMMEKKLEGQNTTQGNTTVHRLRAIARERRGAGPEQHSPVSNCLREFFSFRFPVLFDLSFSSSSLLLPLLHYLSSFFLAFQHSRDSAVSACQTHPAHPSLESLSIPDSASSERFLTEDVSSRQGEEAETVAVLAWQSRIQWAERMIEQHGLQCVQSLQALIQQQEQGQQATVDNQTHSLRASLVEILSLLLVHPSLRSFKHHLLAYLLRHLLASNFFAQPCELERSLACGLLAAVATNCTNDEWQVEKPSTNEEEQQQLTAWMSAVEKHASVPLPRALCTYLCRSLLTLSPGPKPAGVSSAQWKQMVQDFHQHRWSTMQRMLEVHCPSDGDLLTACVDALDGSTLSFVEHVYQCVRMLMRAHIQQQKREGASQSSLLSVVSSVFRASWSSFRDLHGDLPFQAVLAFLALIFESESFALPGNHQTGAPFNTMIRTLVTYGLNRSRFLVYVSYYSSLLWLRYPMYLRGYSDVLVSLVTFHADPNAEVEIIQEKLVAYELAHMIHNWNDATNPSTNAMKSLITSGQLRRAEGIIRCTALHLIQQLPSVMSSLAPAHQSSLRLFFVELAEAAIMHPHMQNDTGAMLGEGNTSFIGKAYLWQLLCVLVNCVSVAGDQRVTLHHLFQSHTWAWFERPISSVLRHLLEVFLSRLYALSPHLLTSEVLPRIQANSHRPTLLASLLLIVAFATLDREEGNKCPELSQQIILLLHPYVACNFGHVRLLAQYLFYRLVREVGPPEWQALPADSSSSAASSSPVSPTASSLLSHLMSYLSYDTDLIRLRGRQEQYFGEFAPRRGCTVQGILAAGEEQHHFLAKPIIELITGLQAEYLSGLREQYDDRLYHTQQESDAPPATSACPAAAASPSSAASASSPSTSLTNFQQKVDVAPLLQLAALREIHEEQSSDSSSSSAIRLRSAVEHRTRAPRQSVIVIASLVDKLPNLAGLSRTCEIFQAERLMLNDLSMVESEDFGSISVTANKWLPIEQLRKEHIAQFILDRQEEGYTCIALEQSAASINLPSYQFPSRVVILLGAEKQGVPVDLLNLVDQCVEIPQLGLIRSLNVHVSASILLWEYTRQNLLGITAQSTGV